MIYRIHPPYQPTISYLGYSLDDSDGNANGRAEADETVEVGIRIANNGTPAANATVTLSSSDPYVSITSPMVQFVNPVSWHDTCWSLNTASIDISSECPDPHWALIELTMSADGGYSEYDSFYIFIGNSRRRMSSIISYMFTWPSFYII